MTEILRRNFDEKEFVLYDSVKRAWLVVYLTQEEFGDQGKEIGSSIIVQ